MNDLNSKMSFSTTLPASVFHGKGPDDYGPVIEDTKQKMRDTAGDQTLTFSHHWDHKSGGMTITAIRGVAGMHGITEAELDAIEVGRTALCNRASVKFTERGYRPLKEDDSIAETVCTTINLLEGLLNRHGRATKGSPQAIAA